MITRGSLRKMIDLLPNVFKETGQERLIIFHCEKGKYYSIIDEQSFLDLNENDPLVNRRIVLFVTFREFETIVTTNQLTLL